MSCLAFGARACFAATGFAATCFAVTGFAATGFADSFAVKLSIQNLLFNTLQCTGESVTMLAGFVSTPVNPAASR